MQSSSFTKKETLALGLMMFALFLGAGNLIFPPAMGQEAGTSLWAATLGFLVTGVGLPVLAIVAIAKSGGNLQEVSNKVGPLFGAIFPLIAYMAIGPLFGIPRTGSVAFEIGALPYLGDGNHTFPLFIFTVIFFAVSYWLSLNPSKLVSRLGKYLTPVLVILLGLLAISGLINPVGAIQSPTENYEQYSFFTGFLEGYLTMDAIAALVFGIVIISRMQERGITDRGIIAKKSVQIGLIAGVGLALVYFSLAYLGATSVTELGMLENGGLILTGVSQLLLGNIGLIMLSFVITIACLTTSVGLISAFGEYLKKVIPAVPYPLTIGIIALFSLIMANMGLTQLIQFSLPMLIMIYPVAIVLIVLSLTETFFQKKQSVFKGAVIGAALISIPEGLITGGLVGEGIVTLFNAIPLSEVGVAWVLPAVIGGIIGYFLSSQAKSVN
ncbi:branched-chain amino acid transport system II carrier protein [Alteribacter populi]|uniref:branched-chain amino acid transport system II carrier protein n=1 Tax=Alteribacter populi TaxID=2011011 RepID=UPI000BBAD3B8|nr:branched-chain amino acid transport system II carrier protein [Alteribacter populi]